MNRILSGIQESFFKHKIVINWFFHSLIKDALAASVSTLFPELMQSEAGMQLLANAFATSRAPGQQAGRIVNSQMLAQILAQIGQSPNDVLTSLYRRGQGVCFYLAALL